MTDPLKEWQRLTRLYSEMGEEELRELAASFADLTEVAQQVLRNEMKRRGLGEPEAIMKSAAEFISPQKSAADENLPWILRESGNLDVLNELKEALGEAGIRSEVVHPQDNDYRTKVSQLQVSGKDAERAEEILARPHQPRARQVAEEEIGEWMPPSCPRCAAPDPVLESVDPFNSWLCEACGAQWRESGEEAEENPEQITR